MTTAARSRIGFQPWTSPPLSGADRLLSTSAAVVKAPIWVSTKGGLRLHKVHSVKGVKRRLCSGYYPVK